MKKRRLALLLALTLPCSFYAQDAGSVDSLDVPPPPVVSAIQASLKDRQVVLTWVPAPDVAGTNVILRAKQPITTANYLAADRRGEVPATSGSFTDAIEGDGAYFYAVLTRDEDGTLYDFFIPASNSTLAPVQAQPQPVAQPVAITSFDAMTRNDAVIVTWTATAPNRQLVLYRSTSPFMDLSSLVSAIVVSTFKDDGAPYVDYPVPGVPYYYAIIDDDSLRAGTVRFKDSANTNRIPVEIPSQYENVKRASVPALRPMPLPWLNVTEEPESVELTFSRETEAKIRDIARSGSISPVTPRKPYVFLSDREASGTGEDLALRLILKNTFTKGAYAEAITQLNDFLSIRRTDDTVARTRFYLGESLFFTGEYSKALFQFLLVEDRYYGQAREWARYAIERL